MFDTFGFDLYPFDFMPQPGGGFVPDLSGTTVSVVDDLDLGGTTIEPLGDLDLSGSTITTSLDVSGSYIRILP